MATTNIGNNIINLTDLSYALAHLTSNFNGKIQEQKDYTDSQVSEVLTELVSVMHFKGGFDGADSSPGAYTPSASIGDVYKVTRAGYVNGIKVEANDTLICTSNVAQANSGNYTTVRNSWLIVQGNTDGVVIGPASATNNNIAVFDGTTGKLIKNSGYTIATSVPSGAVFTDTKVTQTATTTNATYELLFSNTANNNTLTEGARKTSTLTYNPSTKALVTGGTVNGYTLADASAKGVDTSIAANSTSTNLPTSQAVSNFANTTLADYARLDGANFTGPVSFGDSVSADDLTAGQLMVTGNASFTNNINANTINGVEVGSNPKFTDTITTVSVSGSGNAITAASASNGAVTLTKGTTFKTAQTAITKPTAATNQWVSAIGQNANGVIEVDYGTLDTSGTWSGKATTAGTADVAKKISDITSTDTASSSTTWRQVWMSYADGVTGRPAVTSGLTFQTSTNTLKATKFEGALVGNADTATKWASAQTAYVTLGTASTTTTLQGGSSTAQTLGVDGTLGVGNGGTGATTFTSGALLIGNGTSAVGTRAITNNTSNTAVGTGTNIPTMNTIYYGLAQINGNSQNRGVSVYAPTTVGSNNQYLKSTGSGAPSWQTPADSSSASAISSSGTNLTTERDIYYGLPTINNSHSYTSSTTIYAPTAGGTSGYYLKGAGTTTAPTWQAPSDSSSASAISTGTALATERDIYYGLPTINGAHNYTSNTNIYAPTAVGTSGQVLSSSGSGAPTWVDASTVGSKIQIVRW